MRVLLRGSAVSQASQSEQRLIRMVDHRVQCSSTGTSVKKTSTLPIERWSAENTNSQWWALRFTQAMLLWCFPAQEIPQEAPTLVYVGIVLIFLMLDRLDPFRLSDRGPEHMRGSCT